MLGLSAVAADTAGALDGQAAGQAPGVVLAEEQAATPAPTGTALLSAKVQAATMQDILPSAMPISVDGPVVDDAAVLSDDELADVAEAVTRLEDETSLRLFVVYLETFDGIDPEDWADATATKSGLAPEDLLLAVATEDRAQGLSVDVNGPLTAEQHARILAASEAAVADGEWADAATDAARAALATQDPDGFPWWAVWTALGTLAVGAVAWWLVRGRRPRGASRAVAEGEPAEPPADAGAGADGEAEATEPAHRPVAVLGMDAGTVAAPKPASSGSATAAEDPVDHAGSEQVLPAAVTSGSASQGPARRPAPVAPVGALTEGEIAAMSDDELAARADDALVVLDDALRSSAQELALARAESGGARELYELDVVLAEATARAGEAFALRARLVEATPDARDGDSDDDTADDHTADHDARRNLAREVLARCDEASALLDSGTRPLEDARALQGRATELFDACWQRAGGLDRRIERARRDAAALHDEFPAEALRAVTGNADQADRLVGDARRAVDAGRAAGARRDRPFAAAAARGAQHALEQAELLLDALGETRAALADAAPRLDKAVASLTQDVADAERLAGGDPQVTMARAAAKAALKQVEVTGDDADPFTLLARIAAAEGALDRSLAGVRDATEVDARAAALLRDTLSRVDVRVRQADILIGTRRGVVGPEARTRLAEAARLAAEARDLAEARTDRPAALDLARRADLQAQYALDRAVQDAAADDAPAGMPLGGIALTLDGRRGRGAGSPSRRSGGGLLGALTRTPARVRVCGIGGGAGGGGFGSGRA